MTILGKDAYYEYINTQNVSIKQVLQMAFIFDFDFANFNPFIPWKGKIGVPSQFDVKFNLRILLFVLLFYLFSTIMCSFIM